MRIYPKLLITSLIFVASCHPTSRMYSSETAPDQDFSQYHTYAYLPTKDTAYTKMVSKRKVERALAQEVVRQLNKRGMTPDTLHPDCLFTYTLVMHRKYDVNQEKEVEYSLQMYLSDYGQPGYVYVFSSDNRPAVYNGSLNIDTLREGSLVIDMIDQKSNKVVWRSSAQATRQEGSIPSLQETVQTIVPKMFKTFPKK